MAGIPPIFMSGSRLKIKMDGIIIAHAVGFDINVQKVCRHNHTMGEFGVVSVQTLLFSGVTGSLQILQLNPSLLAAADVNALKEYRPDNTGFTVGRNVITTNATTEDKVINNSLKAANTNFKNMFDPAKILLTTTFDIEVWQNYPNEGMTGTIPIKQIDIVRCRLTGQRLGLALAQLTQVTFGFEGSYAVISVPGADGKNTSEASESDIAAIPTA